MNFADRLRNGTQKQLQVQDEPVVATVPVAVDRITCEKVGNLAAYGLPDSHIASILLLSSEQVAAAKLSVEYQKSYQERIVRRAEMAMVLEDGWDNLEERSLAMLHETLEYNRDPRFALQVAAVANRAQRKTPGASGRTIDANRAGSVIVLKMNQKFVQNVQINNTQGVIDVPSEAPSLPRRQHDVPSPSKVMDMLQVENSTKVGKLNTMMEQMEQLGVFQDFVPEK